MKPILAPEAAARLGARDKHHIFIGNPVQDFLPTFLPKNIDYKVGV
jgi:hypothetical protein